MTLRFERVSAAYRRKQILEDVDFTVPQGKITALLGCNGAGKTTLLRCLTGEKTDYRGRILLDGQDLRPLAPAQRARLIACLPQTLPAPRVPLLDLVSFGRAPFTPLSGRLSAEDERIVDDAIASVGLTGRESDWIDTLSGGERRKAFFAMTLAQSAPLIALDEPTAHLDARSRFAFGDLLTHLCRSTGRTILTVMHDLPEVLRLADHIAVLDGGHIVFEGTPADCLAQDIPRRIFGLTVSGSAETGYAVLPCTKEEE